MKKILLITGLLLTSLTSLKANDGAFRAQGNQLVPVNETQVEIRKEILNITRVKGNKWEDIGEYLKVNVQYWFYNPGPRKKVYVGFEAPAPTGDVNPVPVNGGHPYISDFTVFVNGKKKSYGVTVATNKNDSIKGRVVGKKPQELRSQGYDFNQGGGHDFVYYFEVDFDSGITYISHNYNFALSNSVLTIYDFTYDLLAAMRWANGQIDDFTLNIDLGEAQDLFVNDFVPVDSLRYSGTALHYKFREDEYLDFNATLLSLDSGMITCRIKDFVPLDNINVMKFSGYGMCPYLHPVFDSDSTALDKGNLNLEHCFTGIANMKSLIILQNLPYARRGYVFKNEFISDYYTSLVWYKPNPDYRASLESLTEDERLWLAKLEDMLVEPEDLEK